MTDTIKLLFQFLNPVILREILRLKLSNAALKLRILRLEFLDILLDYRLRRLERRLKRFIADNHIAPSGNDGAG